MSGLDSDNDCAVELSDLPEADLGSHSAPQLTRTATASSDLEDRASRRESGGSLVGALDLDALDVGLDQSQESAVGAEGDVGFPSRPIDDEPPQHQVQQLPQQKPHPRAHVSWTNMRINLPKIPERPESVEDDPALNNGDGADGGVMEDAEAVGIDVPNDDDDGDDALASELGTPLEEEETACGQQMRIAAQHHLEEEYSQRHIAFPYDMQDRHTAQDALTLPPTEPPPQGRKHSVDMAPPEARAVVQKRIDAAAMHCMAAVIGLAPEPDRKIRAFSYDLFTFFFSQLYQERIFSAVGVTHLSLAFWEKTSGTYDTGFSDLQRSLLIVELLCILVYILDLYIQYQLLPRATTRGRKSMVYIAIIAIITVDALVHVTGLWRTVRFSRPLRATVLILHSRSMESDVRKLARSAYHVVDVAVFVFVTIMIFAGMAVVLFGPSIHGCSDASTGDAVSLANFGSAFLVFLIASSGDNYPMLSFNAMDCIGPAVSGWFVFTTLFEFIVLAIMVASMCDAWVSARAEQVRRFLEYEKANLTEAFHTLHNEHNNGVTYREWSGLIKRLHPATPNELVEDTYNAIDTDGSGILEMEEWLMISPVLLRDVAVVHDKSKKGPARLKSRTLLRVSTFHGIRYEVNNVLRRRFPGNRALAKFVLRNSLFLFPSLLCTLGNFALMTMYSSTNEKEWENLNLIDNIFMAVSLCEACIRRYALGWRHIANFSFVRYDVYLVFLSSVVVGFFEAAGLLRVATACRFLRLLRLFLTLDMLAKRYKFDYRFKVRRIVRKLTESMPVLTRMGYTLFVAIYFFGLVGMELWDGKFVDNCDDDIRADDCEKSCAADWKADGDTSRQTFDTLGSSLNLMFTLFIDADLATILQMTLCISGPVAAVYWTCFYLVIVVIFSNLIYAVLIESYNLLHSRYKKRRGFVKHLRGGATIKMTPSKLHKRYRVDLDIEESRHSMNQKETQRHRLTSVNPEVAERLQVFSALVESDLAFKAIAASMERRATVTSLDHHLSVESLATPSTGSAPASTGPGQAPPPPSGRGGPAHRKRESSASEVADLGDKILEQAFSFGRSVAVSRHATQARASHAAAAALRHPQQHLPQHQHNQQQPHHGPPRLGHTVQRESSDEIPGPSPNAMALREPEVRLRDVLLHQAENRSMSDATSHSSRDLWEAKHQPGDVEEHTPPAPDISPSARSSPSSYRRPPRPSPPSTSPTVGGDESSPTQVIRDHGVAAARGTTAVVPPPQPGPPENTNEAAQPPEQQEVLRRKSIELLLRQVSAEEAVANL